MKYLLLLLLPFTVLADGPVFDSKVQSVILDCSTLPTHDIEENLINDDLTATFFRTNTLDPNITGLQVGSSRACRLPSKSAVREPVTGNELPDGQYYIYVVANRAAGTYGERQYAPFMIKNGVGVPVIPPKKTGPLTITPIY